MATVGELVTLARRNRWEVEPTTGDCEPPTFAVISNGDNRIQMEGSNDGGVTADLYAYGPPQPGAALQFRLGELTASTSDVRELVRWITEYAPETGVTVPVAE